MANTHGLKILQWNLASLKTRGLELLSHIQEYKYDVIVLQEANINKKDRYDYPIIG